MALTLVSLRAQRDTILAEMAATTQQVDSIADRGLRSDYEAKMSRLEKELAAVQRMLAVVNPSVALKTEFD